MTHAYVLLAIAALLIAGGLLIALSIVKSGHRYDNLFKTEFDHDDN